MSLNELARSRYDKMVPVESEAKSKSDAMATVKEEAESGYDAIAPIKQNPNVLGDGDKRSFRTEFCRSVAQKARVITNGLISNAAWIRKFEDDSPSKVHHALDSQDDSNPLNDLRRTAKSLIDNLQQYRHKEKNDAFLVIVFDEASSLLRERDKTESGLYVAFNRIISCLKEFPIWTFFLSTESLIGELLPPSNVKPTGNYVIDRSARLVLDANKPPLKRFPPFLALQLDVEDRRIMQDPKTMNEELRKPLSNFADPKHMASFGRPLWYAYNNPEDMNNIAKLKLLGGQQRASYKPSDENHVFAALSFRLSLDVCVQNPRSIPFSRNAVSSFMRVIKSMDHDTGLIDTLTPSEPVLAKAAMEHLCDEANWTNSIRTLTKELLEGGLVDKGHKGELYVRLMFILAHDWLRWAQYLQKRSAPEFKPTFTVSDFLEALYAKDHHYSIQKIEGVLQGRMNFTHFIPTKEKLTAKVIPDLCHDLLRRSAAMQLELNQQTYDLLIPWYNGKETEKFQPSKCGVILAQIKNRMRATTVQHMFEENFTKISPTGPPNPKVRKPEDSIRKDPDFVFREIRCPILFLHFDLDPVRSDKATSPIVQVLRNDSKIAPDLWAIHSRGHDKTVFGCLEHMDGTNASQQFFLSMPKVVSSADELCMRNGTFDELPRSFRYKGFDSANVRAEEVGIKGMDDVRAQGGVKDVDDVEVQGGIKEADDITPREGGTKNIFKNFPFRSK